MPVPVLRPAANRRCSGLPTGLPSLKSPMTTTLAAGSCARCRIDLAVLFEARPPMVDSFSLLTGRVRTHADGGAYDRILVSKAIARGLAGLRLEEVLVGTHRHGARADRALYTDHFPVSVRLGLR